MINNLKIYSIQTVTNVNESFGYGGDIGGQKTPENHFNNNGKFPCNTNASESLCRVTASERWSFNKDAPDTGCNDEVGGVPGRLRDACENNDQIWKFDESRGNYQVCCSAPDNRPESIRPCPQVGNNKVSNVNWFISNDTAEKVNPQRIVTCTYNNFQPISPDDIDNYFDIINSKIQGFTGSNNNKKTLIDNNLLAKDEMYSQFCSQKSDNCDFIGLSYFPQNGPCGGFTGCSMFNDKIHGAKCKQWATTRGSENAPVEAKAKVIESFRNYCDTNLCAKECLCRNAGKLVKLNQNSSVIDSNYNNIINNPGTGQTLQQPFCWYIPCQQNIISGAGGYIPQNVPVPNAESCNFTQICQQLISIGQIGNSNVNITSGVSVIQCGTLDGNQSDSPAEKMNTFWKTYKWVIIGLSIAIITIIIIIIIVAMILHAKKQQIKDITPPTPLPYGPIDINTS
jgi:hypothetical protein